MPDLVASAGRPNGRLSLRLYTAGLLIGLLIAICPPDLSVLLALIIGSPIAIALGIYLLTLAARRRFQGFPFRLGLLCILTFLVVHQIEHPTRIRDHLRWLVWASDYKTLVLAQPGSAHGDLKHMEWDGWGFAGQDNTVFLVFDPGDTLTPITDSHARKFDGLPCEVPSVRCLEQHWYLVRTYTDQGWDDCSQ